MKKISNYQRKKKLKKDLKALRIEKLSLEKELNRRISGVKFYRLIPLKISTWQKIKLLFGSKLILCVEVDIDNHKINDKGII